MRFVRPLLFSLVLAVVARADVTLPSLFCDHAVLQRDRPLPVWGMAAPGEKVTVSFAGQSQSATADAEGRWRVTLAALPASHESRELTVQGKNRLVLQDVLVGEVWFCSGQSNMEKPLGLRKGQRPTDGYDAEIAAANYPKLRLFQVPRPDLKRTDDKVFHWLVCTPDNLRQSDFSAAAYFFGVQVQQTLGVPVGMIHSSFGGTSIEAWMPPEAFEHPKLRGVEKVKYPSSLSGTQATELFTSMTLPYLPYALRGFLWYQAEANVTRGVIDDYELKQKVLIDSWRKRWESPDAAFFGVLLAPFDYSRWDRFPVNDLGLPLMREKQMQGLNRPGTGYIVTNDLVDDLHDIHPVNKRDIGQRLARLALHDTYGRKDIVARGPKFVEQRELDAALELTFENAEGLHTKDGLAPTGFELAGDDHVFHPAAAKILEGGKVFLSSGDVAQPVAARFAWREDARPALCNSVGLPAEPFRTDDWPVEAIRPVQEKK